LGMTYSLEGRPGIKYVCDGDVGASAGRSPQRYVAWVARGTEAALNEALKAGRTRVRVSWWSGDQDCTIEFLDEATAVADPPIPALIAAE
jgi:hypothetical protein